MKLPRGFSFGGVVALQAAVRVQPSPVLLEELRGVFGRERVRLVRGPSGGGNGEGRRVERAMTGGD